jgi:ferrous iron transport protein B
MIAADARGTVVFGMYLLGIIVAVLVGLVLSRTALSEEEPSPLVMVMPEFRLPNARTVWMLVWLRTKAFVQGAGTTILVASMAVWLLLAIPVGGGDFTDTEVGDSAFGIVAKGVAPALDPAGFGEWEHSGALLTGFVAKEVVVSTMAQLHVVEAEEVAVEAPGLGGDIAEIGRGFVDASADTVKAIPGVVGLDFFDLEDDSDTRLQTAVRDSFEESSGGKGALAALAFMVFVLLYTPCMAAVGAFRHEFGTKWMWVSVIGQFVMNRFNLL